MPVFLISQRKVCHEALCRGDWSDTGDWDENTIDAIIEDAVGLEMGIFRTGTCSECNIQPLHITDGIMKYLEGTVR